MANTFTALDSFLYMFYTALTMKCTCPECKNEISLARYPNLSAGMVIECETCGILLEVISIVEGVVTTEIVDEGK